MRRSILLCVLVLFVIGTGAFALSSRAKGMTPAPSVFDGYPTLAVTVTFDAYVLDRDEVPAGLVVVSVTNTTEDSVDAAIVGPAPGQTAAELIAAAAVPPAQPAIWHRSCTTRRSRAGRAWCLRMKRGKSSCC